MVRSWPELLDLAKRTAWWFTKGLAIPLTLYEGKLRGSDTILRCWTVGTTHFPADYRSRVYDGEPRTVRVLRLPFFYIGRYLRSRAHTYDLFVGVKPIHRSAVLDAHATYCGPSLITQEIDTSGGWDAVASNMARAKRNWVNRFKANPDLVIEVSREPEDLRFFYDRMLMPYVTRRFGVLGDYDSFERIEKMFKLGGFLMFISKDGKRIAASLCQMNDKMISYNRVGLLDGDESLLETGALMAVYHGHVQLAIEHQLPLLDLKQSRPFLKDGVYDNKARWGARVTRYAQAWTQVHYLIPRPSASVANAFEICPVIVYDGQQLRALVGYTAEPQPSQKDLQKHIKQYYLQGIQRVTVFTSEKHCELEVEAQ